MINNRNSRAYFQEFFLKGMLLAILVFWASIGQAQTVAPLGGLGSVQFLDNNGVPLTNGVLYSYQAGTSTQQATYTDSSGTTQNPNPIPFGSGARATVWLSVGSFYKFVLCSANDGPFCASSDILFSVDNVPGGSTSSGGGGSSPFTGVFISGSASPATSGILRLASSDQICWRNASGSTNLCISKDSNDLLSWTGGSLKFPEIPCPSGVAGFDLICADNTAHRWKMTNNGGTLFLIPGVGTPGTSGHLIVFSSNGIDLQDGGVLPPTPEQIAGFGSALLILTNGLTNCSNSVSNCLIINFVNVHTLVRFEYVLTQSPAGCTTQPSLGVWDFTGAASLYSTSIANGATTGYVDSGPLSVTIPAGHRIGVGPVAASGGCGTAANVAFPTMVYQ